MPPLVFEAQTCAKDSRTSAWTWCAAGATGWPTPRGRARQSCLNLLPYVGPGWIVLGISARSHVDAATLRRALERMDAAWSEGEEHMAKLSVNAMIACGAQHGGGLQRAQQQQRAGRHGRGLLSSLRLRGGHGVGLRLRQEAAEPPSRTVCAALQTALRRQRTS